MLQVTKSHKIRQIRAEKIWKLVNIEGYSYTDAWKKAVPITKAKKANWHILAKRACDAFEKEHAHDLQKLLEAAGLGLQRVVQEISKSLNQKKVELYQGKIVKDENGNVILFDDSAIQQRGRELLVKIHGLEKQKMELTGEDGEPVGVVFLPQEMTPEEWQKKYGSGPIDHLETPAEAGDSS